MEFGKILENLDSQLTKKITEVPQKLIDSFNELFKDDYNAEMNENQTDKEIKNVDQNKLEAKEVSQELIDAFNELINGDYDAEINEDQTDKEIQNTQQKNYDDDFNEFKEGYELKSNAEYVLNGANYMTDSNSRIDRFSTVLTNSLPETARNGYAQLKAGGEDRRDTDQGGHILARVFGGDPGIGNMMPLDSRSNQGDYKAMEKDILNAIGDGKTVNFEAKLYYEGESERPSKIVATTEIEGMKTVYTFNNERDMSLLADDKNISIEDRNNVSDLIEGKNEGYISSKVEEYDSDGNLAKTTYTIRDSENNPDTYSILHP